MISGLFNSFWGNPIGEQQDQTDPVDSALSQVPLQVDEEFNLATEYPFACENEKLPSAKNQETQAHSETVVDPFEAEFNRQMALIQDPSFACKNEKLPSAKSQETQAHSETVIDPFEAEFNRQMALIQDPSFACENETLPSAKNKETQAPSATVVDPFETEFNRQMALIQTDSNTIIEQLKIWVMTEYRGAQHMHAQHYLALCIKKLQKQALPSLSLDTCKINIKRALERDFLLYERNTLLFQCLTPPRQDPVQSRKTQQLHNRVRELQREEAYLLQSMHSPSTPLTHTTHEAEEQVKLLEQRAQLFFEQECEKQLKKNETIRLMQQASTASKKLLEENVQDTAKRMAIEKLRKTAEKCKRLEAAYATLQGKVSKQEALCQQKQAKVEKLAKTVDACFKKTIEKEKELEAVRASSLKEIQRLQDSIKQSIESLAREPERLDQEITKHHAEMTPQIETAYNTFYEDLNSRASTQRNMLFTETRRCCDRIMKENNGYFDTVSAISQEGNQKMQKSEDSFQEKFSELDVKFDKDIILNRNDHVATWNGVNAAAHQERNKNEETFKKNWQDSESSREIAMSAYNEEDLNNLHASHTEDVDQECANCTDTFNKAFGEEQEAFLERCTRYREEQNTLTQAIEDQVDSLRGKA